MRIECFFQGFKNADKAVEELKSAGFSNAYSDIKDHFTRGNTNRNISSTNSAPWLFSMVSVDGNEEAAPLSVANPIVSGISGFDEIANFNCCVVVEIKGNDAERAMHILKSFGGDFKQP